MDALASAGQSSTDNQLCLKFHPPQAKAKSACLLNFIHGI